MKYLTLTLLLLLPFLFFKYEIHVFLSQLTFAILLNRRYRITSIPLPHKTATTQFFTFPQDNDPPFDLHRRFFPFSFFFLSFCNYQPKLTSALPFIPAVCLAAPKAARRRARTPGNQRGPLLHPLLKPIPRAIR